MSGSSGGGGGAEPGFSCETISFSADINNPQEDALSGLDNTFVLRVAVISGRVVAVRTDTETVVGSINWTYNNRLIDCMEGGHRYQASVRSVEDGLIRVLVSAAP